MGMEAFTEGNREMGAADGPGKCPAHFQLSKEADVTFSSILQPVHESIITRDDRRREENIFRQAFLKKALPTKSIGN